MATKDPIQERRLRLVYDALDNGSNKAAVKEADKVLKKHSSSQAAKALKALALLRLARKTDACLLIEELEQQQITDDATLHALTHCFKEMAQPERIARMYEWAVKHLPRSEDLLSALFMSYVRMLDYRKQQQSAMQLHKEFPRNTYLCWAVMSNVMQSMTDSSMSDMYLSLAKRMMDKLIQTDKMDTAAELSLYLLVLELKGEHELCIEVLNGQLMVRTGLHNTLWQKQYTILEHQVALHQYDYVLTQCRSQLMLNLDDWRLYSTLFNATFAAIEHDATCKSDMIVHVTDIVLACVQHNQTLPVMLRGPCLARLECIKGLLERDLVVRAELGTCLLGEPTKLLSDYVQQFGDRASCFSDLRPYLCLLGEQQQHEFVRLLVCELAEESGATASVHVRAVHRHVCALRLRMCLSAQPVPALALVQARACLQYYVQATQLSSNNESAEQQAADAYVMLFAQLLWQCYMEQNDTTALHELIIVLECAHTASPHNHQLTLVLLKAYASIGVVTRSKELVTEMSIKHMQLDSLSYCLLDVARPYGSLCTASLTAQQVMHYFANNEREMLESLVQAYQKGAFVQIVDMVQYNEQSRMSLAHTAALVLHHWLYTLTTTSTMESVHASVDRASVACKPIQWTKLRDNRDFSILPNYTCADSTALDADHAKRSFQQFVDVLRYQHLLLCMMQVLHSEHSTTSSLHELCTQLKAHHRHCQTVHSLPISCNLHDVLPNQWHVFVNGTYFELLDCVVDCAYLVLSATRTQQKPVMDKQSAAEPDSGHVSSSTPSNTSLCSSLDTDTDTDNMGTDHNAQSSDLCASASQSPVNTHRARALTPDRLHAMPDAQHVQAIVTRMICAHQLQKDPATFSYVQLCHVSNLVQTLGAVLNICALLCSLLTPAKHTNNSTGTAKHKKKHTNSRSRDSSSISVSALSHTLTALSTTGVDDVRLGVHELVSVLCRVPAALQQLCYDLQTMINEQSLLAPSNVLHRQHVPKELHQSLDVYSAEFVHNCRDSYRSSVDELLLVIHVQEQLCKQLKTAASVLVGPS